MEEIKNLDSNKYWNESDERRHQRFYITFCLLNSAIFDYSVGLDLEKQKKLNWAASCFYYSMLHCARLLIFIPFGNFPTYHKETIKFLKSNSTSSSEKYKFNWLNDFTPGFNNDYDFSARVYYKETLLHYYNTNYEDLNFPNKLKEISNILINSKKLREDSNYEALLIAHENFHPRLKSLFINLSDIIQDKSLIVLSYLIDIFKKYIDVGDFEINLNELKYFINNYINDKLKERLESRIKDTEIMSLIDKILNQLQFNDIVEAESTYFSHRFEDSFSMNQFSGKSRLFDEFEEKINNLKSS